MMETRARAQAALESMAKQHANWASTQQHTNEATSESDRAALESAAKAAHEYAMSFVQRAHATQEAGEAEARQPPSAHDASAYDLLAQRQMEQQQHGKQKARKSTGAEHSQRENANYRFAQTGVFLEEGIKMQTVRCNALMREQWIQHAGAAHSACFLFSCSVLVCRVPFRSRSGLIHPTRPLRRRGLLQWPAPLRGAPPLSLLPFRACRRRLLPRQLQPG